MKEVIYKGEDAMLGRFGFVKKGQKLEVNDKEFAFISAKSLDQFDLVDEKPAPKASSKAVEVEPVVEEPTTEQPAKRTRRRSE